MSLLDGAPDGTLRAPLPITQHLLTHSPLKPYGCEECGKSYRLISLLNLHKKRHSGEARYRCGDCGKLFTTSGNLKRHQLVHSGQKPYQCDYCGRSFSDPTSKMRHLETHDTDKEHKCPHCDKKFNQVCTLLSQHRSAPQSSSRIAHYSHCPWTGTLLGWYPGGLWLVFLPVLGPGLQSGMELCPLGKPGRPLFPSLQGWGEASFQGDPSETLSGCR